MTAASRFLARPEGPTLRLTLDGAPVTARAGDTVAAAMLAHSGDAFRRTAKGAPRTAYCMMGVCYDCLVEIDGRANMQACMTVARDGMTVRRQEGLRPLGRGGDA